MNYPRRDMANAPLPSNRGKIPLCQKIELGLLGGVYLGVVFSIYFTTQSQLLTPIPIIWQVTVCVIGCGLAVRMIYLSRDWLWRASDGKSKNFVSGLVLISLTVVAWSSLADDLAGAFLLRRGDKIVVTSYPIDHLVKPRGKNDPAILISPYGRTVRIPVSAKREQEIGATCAKDDECYGSGLCVDVLIQRASGGAVRVLVNDHDDQDETPVKPCKSH